MGREEGGVVVRVLLLLCVHRAAWFWLLEWSWLVGARRWPAVRKPTRWWLLPAGRGPPSIVDHPSCLVRRTPWGAVSVVTTSPAGGKSSVQTAPAQVGVGGYGCCGALRLNLVCW